MRQRDLHPEGLKDAYNLIIRQKTQLKILGRLKKKKNHCHHHHHQQNKSLLWGSVLTNPTSIPWDVDSIIGFAQ